MEDKILLIVAAIFGLLGITALFFISASIEPGDSLASADPGDTVELTGRIVSSQNRGDVTILTLEHTSTVIVFNRIDARGEVRIRGEVSVYDGKKELIAESVTSISPRESLQKFLKK